MEKLNIGQMVIYNKDSELRGALSDDPVVIKKGTKAFVGADRKCPKLNFLDGKILMLSDKYEIDGFSVEGLAEWLYQKLSWKYPLSDFFEDYDIDATEFKETIADELEELDMWDNTGNRK